GALANPPGHSPSFRLSLRAQGVLRRHPPADREWQKGYLDRRPRPKEKTHCPPKVDRPTTRFILVVFGVRRSSPLWIGRIKAAKNAAPQKKKQTNFRPHLSRSRD